MYNHTSQPSSKLEAPYYCKLLTTIKDEVEHRKYSRQIIFLAQGLQQGVSHTISVGGGTTRGTLEIKQLLVLFIRAGWNSNKFSGTRA